MNKCQKIQQEFDSALKGELSGDKLGALESHLSVCGRCSTEYEQTRQALECLNSFSRPELDEDYWDGFMDRLEDTLDTERSRGRGWLARAGEYLSGWMSPMPGALRPALTGAALLLIGIVIGRTFLSSGPSRQPQTVITLQTAEQAQGYARAASYFGKARLVLLGLVNYDTDNVELLPSTLERQVAMSRELVNEIPVLRSELDPRHDAALLALISELETVLLQTANLDNNYGIVEIKLIQEGAQRKALLFKIDIGENILSKDEARARTEPGTKPGGKTGGSLL